MKVRVPPQELAAGLNRRTGRTSPPPGDPLDAEAPIDDRVLGFVLIGEALKMLFEKTLEDVDSARLVQSLGDRGELKG
jgi:hypothetical protein